MKTSFHSIRLKQ